MSVNSETMTQGRLVMEPLSTDPSIGSINAETYQVEVHDPKGSTINRLSPEEMSQVRAKTNKIEKAKYFALKEGYFEKAVEFSKTDLYVTEVDGNFIGAWLVTEIDHWDNEKERLVLLTQKQLIIVRFNFITTKVEDHRKIPLVNCTRMQTSNLAYSSSTFGFYQNTTQRCNQLGLRIHWNAARLPGSFDFWNPWSHDIPFITLMSHLSVEVNDTLPDFVDFASFQKSLIAAASADISRSLVTDQEPIQINVIMGLSAVVHNQSKLGFSRDRGGVCF